MGHRFARECAIEIDDMEVCLFTTRRPDGRLVTRPMQVQERTSGTDLWFVTDIESEGVKVRHSPSPSQMTRP